MALPTGSVWCPVLFNSLPRLNFYENCGAIGYFSVNSDRRHRGNTLRLLPKKTDNNVISALTAGG
jgi:hypothetical protein